VPVRNGGHHASSEHGLCDTDDEMLPFAAPKHYGPGDVACSVISVENVFHWWCLVIETKCKRAYLHTKDRLLISVISLTFSIVSMT